MKTRRELENLLLANTQGGVISTDFAKAIAVLAGASSYGMSPICALPLSLFAGSSSGKSTALAELNRMWSSKDESEEGGVA